MSDLLKDIDVVFKPKKTRTVKAVVVERRRATFKTAFPPEPTDKDYYCIPKWCRMPPAGHFDGMGGCWGISSSKVFQQGKRYCMKCEYAGKVEKP